MLAKECCMSTGVGKSKNGLPSFDKALIDAGVGNYNLVRLSSILPSNHEWVPVQSLPVRLPEGSLLPTAYSTITSDKLGDKLISTIGVGIPVDFRNVCVIMEYSALNVPKEQAVETLHDMIKEAFQVRGWELDNILFDVAEAEVEEEGTKYTTFACISEW